MLSSLSSQVEFPRSFTLWILYVTDVLSIGLLDPSLPLLKRAYISNWTVALHFMRDLEHRGIALPRLDLGARLSAQDAALPSWTGLPILNMTSPDVVSALQLTCLRPPEIQHVVKLQTSLLQAFDAHSAELAGQLMSQQHSVGKSRSHLRKSFMLQLEDWKKCALSKCAWAMRLWCSGDTLLGPIRMPNGKLLCPLPVPHQDSGPVEDEDLWQTQTAEASNTADNARAAQDAAHGRPPVDPLLHARHIVESASCLLEVFALDMLEFFAGRLGMALGHRLRGRPFGTAVHPLFSYFEKALCLRIDDWSFMDKDNKLAIFELGLWFQAQQLSDEDENGDGQVALKLQKRSIQHKDVIAATCPREMFCNVVLDILQHPQWSSTGSAAVLQALLDDKQRAEQLVALRDALDALVSTNMFRPGTVLCLPAMRAKVQCVECSKPL